MTAKVASWFETRAKRAPHHERVSAPRIPKGGQMMVGHPRHHRPPTNPAQALNAMTTDQILRPISESSPQPAMAESTSAPPPLTPATLAHPPPPPPPTTIAPLPPH